MEQSKAVPSTPEDDALYLHDTTGWYVFSSRARHIEVAKYVGIPHVYCVGQYPGKIDDPDVVFIQPSQARDPRNGKVAYLVVHNKEYAQHIANIMRRKAEPEEVRQVEQEQEQMSELARKGLL